MKSLSPLLVLLPMLSVSSLSAEPHPDAIPNSHAPGEVDDPSNVQYIVKNPKSLPGIVLDETEAVLKGKWQYSTHTPPYVGFGYLHDQKSGKGEKSVTWSIKLPTSGVWEVRISHCTNIRRATNTPITIHHAEGVETIEINKQQVPEHGNLFRSLGEFRFEAEKPAVVVVSNSGTDPKKVAIADAVQFLPVEELSPESG
ncbi:MAG: xanthan lyase [Verrucomicrobiota bacterium]